MGPLGIGHHSFRPNLSGHLSIRPSLSGSLIPVISPCSQSQGRKRFPVGRIVVRKHSPSANFSGDFFSTPQGAPGGDLQFPKAPEPETIHARHARFSGRRLHLTRRRVRAREPLSGDALPPPGSPDADQPPFYLFCHPSPARASFGVLLLPRALRSVFRRPPAIFFNSNPCTCLGKCSSTFPVHDKIRNGIITSIQRHVTRIRGQI
ncbi:hypothetical protein CK203_084127 [Vitis vinifera]|uniref:Uncharacterized protein n=1 Tax=Vitis vinifera TaxID=29760 RepID=A0A438DUC5_VITVI|nr:hypothetical protein CK203_084127 [Vitis vinifera]